MTAALAPTTPATPAPDRWRTNMLVAVAALQGIVAVLFCIGWVQELRGYLADTDLRAIARPFFLNLTPTCVTLANVLLATGTIAALCTRRDPRRSRRFLLFAFAVALPLQIVPHLVPMAWSYSFGDDVREQADAILAKYAPLSSLGGMIDVLPFLLSINVGLSRAGMRQLRVHPESPMGATMGFAASLQLGLTATVALAFVEPLMPRGWAPIGLCLMALHYGGAAAICFLLARNGVRRTRLLRLLLSASACCVLVPGVVELLIGLWGSKVWDHYLFAWGERDGLVSVHEVPQHVLLFVTRSMLTALAANDLLARSSA